MEKEKTVDCVILNYNDAVTTIELINLLESYSVLSHIIVVDNCSTDDSISQISAYTSGKVILIEAENNGGYGSGNNMGVFYSYIEFSSKYVVIANPDVQFSESCIKKLIDVMDDDPTCAICAPIQLDRNGFVIPDFAWKLPGKWSSIFSAGHFLHNFFWKNYGLEWIETQKSNDAISAIVDCLPGALLMVRSEVFVNVKGYDERNFLYWEEAILAKKVQREGFVSRLLLDDIYIHKHSVSIDKSIPSVINRTKLLQQGRAFYLENYSGASRIQVSLGKMFFKLCILERTIIFKVKHR